MAVQYHHETVLKASGAAPASQSFSWALDTNWPVSMPVNTLVWWTEGVAAVSTWKHGTGTSFGFVDKDGVTFTIWAGSNDGGAFGLATAITDTWSAHSLATGDSGFSGRGDESNATHVSYDTDGFTVSWSPNTATARVLHFLAFGGVQESAIIDWIFNTGAQSVVVPFCFDLMFNLSFVSAGDPGSALSSQMGFGFANHALQQGMTCWHTQDTGVVVAGHNHSNCNRLLLPNRIAALVGGNPGANLYDAEITAVTSSGFDYTGVDHTGGALGFSPGNIALCIKGIGSNIGVSSKPTSAAPATHTITLTGLDSPKAAIAIGVQAISGATPLEHDRFGIGVYDGTRQAAAIHEAEDDRVNIGAGAFGFDLVGSCHAYARDDRFFIKVDNAASVPPGGGHNTPTIDAEAIVSSLTPSALELQWTTNDAIATELLYLVMGEGDAGTCPETPIIPILWRLYTPQAGPTEQCPPDLQGKFTSIPAHLAYLVVGHWDAHLSRYLVTTPGPECDHNTVLWEFMFRGQEVNVYRRTQDVAFIRSFYRDFPLQPDLMPAGITFEQLPMDPTDPVLISSRPIIVSGDFDGNVFEHEMLTDDNGVARTSTITFGPLPKDPMISAFIDKRLANIRFRGRRRSDTVINVYVRPIWTDTWTLIGTYDQDSRPERATIKLDGDGLSGEQYMVKLEETSLVSSPRFQSMTLFGTHTGAFFKE